MHNPLNGKIVTKKYSRKNGGCLRRVEGAFSVVAMTRTKLIGVRDPLGVRPLVLGKIGDGWALSSETCALDIIGAEFVREIKPGEMVVIQNSGVESHFPSSRKTVVFVFLSMFIFQDQTALLVDIQFMRLGDK